jgi:hypothetical protein
LPHIRSLAEVRRPRESSTTRLPATSRSVADFNYLGDAGVGIISPAPFTKAFGNSPWAAAHLTFVQGHPRCLPNLRTKRAPGEESEDNEGKREAELRPTVRPWLLRSNSARHFRSLGLRISCRTRRKQDISSADLHFDVCEVGTRIIETNVKSYCSEL